MNARLITIKENLNAAIAGIRSLHLDLLTQANTQKADLIRIINDLSETHASVKGLGNICTEAGAALLDIAEVNHDIADKIDDTLYQFDNIPVCGYENFVDFCAQCGREIHKDETFDKIDNGEFICSDCICEEVDEEAEVEEDEEDIVEDTEEVIVNV